MSIKVIKVSGTFETLEGKYTGMVVSAATTGLDRLAALCCKDLTASANESEFKLAVRAIAEQVAIEVCENLNTVSLSPVVTFAPGITGSVESMDAPLGDGNGFTVIATSHPQLVKAVEGIVPKMGDSADAPRIDTVADKAGAGTGVISGTEEFYISGSNISAQNAGEGIELLKADGTAAAAARAVGVNESGICVSGQLGSAPEPGAYTLVLATHGHSTPDAELVKLAKKVKVV